MHFALHPEQQELIDAVATVLAAECTPSDLRAIAEGSTGRSKERWDVLSELGAMALLAPESAGGLALSEVEMVGVLEAAGKAVLPEPFAESAALGVSLLLALPGQSDLLQEVATGTARASVGGVEVGAGGALLTTSAEGSGFRTPRVVGAGVVDHYLLFAKVGDEVALYRMGKGDVKVHAHTSIDPTRVIGDLMWEPKTDALVRGSAAEALTEEVATLGALTAAAQLIGLAGGAIAMSAEYAKARQQFGKPIGSFQAVKHHLANAKVRLDFARPAVFRAADSLARNLDSRHRDSALAKALASDAGDIAARVGLQVHGAIGYTWECDLQFYLKRIWVLSAAWGDAVSQRARVLSDALAKVNE